MFIRKYLFHAILRGDITWQSGGGKEDRQHQIYYSQMVRGVIRWHPLGSPLRRARLYVDDANNDIIIPETCLVDRHTGQHYCVDTISDCDRTCRQRET